MSATINELQKCSWTKNILHNGGTRFYLRRQTRYISLLPVLSGDPNLPQIKERSQGTAREPTEKLTLTDAQSFM